MKTIRIITQGKMYKTKQTADNAGVQSDTACLGCAFRDNEKACISPVKAVESATGWDEPKGWVTPVGLCGYDKVFVEVQK